MNELIEIFPDNIDRRKLQKVVDVLKAGGTVIYPTDTVYTLGCALSSQKGLEKVSKLKGVKLEKARFSIVCADLSHISDFSQPVSNPVFKLMKRLLPGSFTFILEANRNVPRIFAANRKTIGIRVPDHPVCIELVRMLGEPLVSTSIHDEDEILEYSVYASDIYEKWGEKVECVIDSGPGGLIPSTVLDCTTGTAEVIRHGKGIELVHELFD